MTLPDLLRVLAARLRGSGAGDLRERLPAQGDLAVAHLRPTRWLPDGSPDPDSYAPVPEESTACRP